MSAPNEPGGHRPADTADVPPWQRGVPRGAVSAPDGGAEARINRFAGGGPAVGADADGAPADSYRSELPDLSGSRPPSRPVPTSRPAVATGAPGDAPTRSTGGRVAVATRSRATGPVRASMQVRRIDPWSVLKVSLVLGVALFFVWMIAVAFLYLVLGGMGVWSRLNSNVGDLLTQGGGAELVSSSSIFGSAALVGLVNIVLLAAMATVGSLIYNLTTDLVGGIEVTLADRD